MSKYFLINLIMFLPVIMIIFFVVTNFYSSQKIKEFFYKIVSLLVFLLVLTAIFDNLMIYLNLFTYQENKISGYKIGLAPIEDFAYPVAVVLLISCLREVTRKDKYAS